MSAHLIALPPPSADLTSGRELWQRLQDARTAAGAGVGRSDTPGYALYRAGCDFGLFWRRRAERLQRQLQAALATDALTDDQRASVITALTGATSRDAKLLSAGEAALIERYRALSQADRAMVARSVKRLSELPAGGER